MCVMDVVLDGAGLGNAGGNSGRRLAEEAALCLLSLEGAGYFHQRLGKGFPLGRARKAWGIRFLQAGRRSSVFTLLRSD